jgi:hypothetical protein
MNNLFFALYHKNAHCIFIYYISSSGGDRCWRNRNWMHNSNDAVEFDLVAMVRDECPKKMFHTWEQEFPIV